MPTLAPVTAKFIALVLPLGLDTLGVALALGMAGVPAERRLRLSFLFAGFEALMPLVGVALGVPLGRAIGGAADYVAIALLAGLGLYMLVGEEAEGSERLMRLSSSGVSGSILLGLSISLDELAIGFSAGLLGVPVPALIVAIAVQAFAVTQIGVRLGGRARPSTSEVAEKLAAVALLVLAAVLLVVQLH